MSATESAASAPRLLSRPETAELLGVSERTLFALTKRGDVPAVRIGGRVLYDPRDLVGFIDSRKVASHRPVPPPPGGAS
jgi:excisionase family DNA binding protein